MPSHLHPRSRATSALFTVTLLTSFVVVGLPHILPCPAPRRSYADSETIMSEDGRIVLRRHAESITDPKGESPVGDRELQTVDRARQKGGLTAEQAMFFQLQEEARILEKEKRECPVPKPGGFIGEILGFKGSKVSKPTSEKS